MRAMWIGVLVLVLAPVALAEPPAPMDDRVEILGIEMRRGPAEALEPFLDPEGNALSRAYAIRALGRIGDRGGAPDLLGDLLEEGTPDLRLALWAAGIAQTDKLYEPIQKHLKADDAEIVAAAAEALGWTGKADAINDLTPLLHSRDPVVRRGALMGLARLRPEGLLERVAPLVHDADPGVQRAAGFACWMIAGARARAAKAQDEAWDGDPRVARRFVPLLKDASPDRRMDGLRALAALMPKDFLDDDVRATVTGLLEDPDPRVVQDAIWRLMRARKGDVARAFLDRALGHADPKVRQMAAETHGQHAYEPSRASLAAALAKEPDARVKEVLVLELARLGDTAPWTAWKASSERSETVERALRQLTDVRVLQLSKADDALATLLRAAQPTATGRGLHAVVLMELLSGLEGNEASEIEDWLAQLLPGGGPFDVDDPYVAASAIGLVGTNRYWKRYADLKQACRPENRDLLHGEVRLALAGAFGELAADADCPPEEKAWMTAWLRRAVYGDLSAWVRAKAKDALETLGVEDLPAEDVLPPTDWKGLPRPTTPILGIDLSKGHGEWLTEREILQLADAIYAARPLFRFETTQGAFDVRVFSEQAPVHCVSLLLAVHAGIYDGTRWHRVVPNFVIQGGDPHGHGAGNAGWYVPDEISAGSYERGVLGMPKSRKDDGGCQLFFMHTHYLPLDGRYTAYGQVVAGMGVVDTIRVGDTITKARIVTE